MTPRPQRLLDQVRDAVPVRHHAYSTEKTYVYWIKRFVLHHNKRHPMEMGEKEISEFLTLLAVEENVTALTQHQAAEAVAALGDKGSSWAILRLTKWPVLLGIRESPPQTCLRGRNIGPR